MSVNYDIWGNPEDWQSLDSAAYDTGEFKKPKEGVTYYQAAYAADKLIIGEAPTDVSLAFWGIGTGSIICHPTYLAPYWDDDTIKTAVRPVYEDPKEVPMIFNWAVTPENTPSAAWTQRYAPNPLGEDPITAQGLYGYAAFVRTLITSFNYQKVMLVPYVRICWTTPDNSSWHFTNVALKEYIDNKDTTYASYGKIVSIGYQLAIGDGIDTNRSTGHKELGHVFPVNYPGSSETYQASSSSRLYKWFSTPYGINTLDTSGSQSNIMLITPWRSYNSVNYNNLHLIADADTGLRYTYCQNYYASGNIYGQVPVYYYNPDDGMWKINDIWNSNYSTYAQPFPYIEVTNNNLDDVKEYVLKQIAYLGLPFVYDPNDASRGQIGDLGVYLPVFDEDGITTGEYKEGRDAIRLPNSEWVDGREGSGYDPNRQDDDGDEGIKVRPSTPAFTLASHGTKCYALVETDIDEIFDDIYGRSSSSWSKLIKGLQMFGSDPMGAIISFKWYPFSFSSTTNSAVYLGNTAINPLHQYPVIDSTTNSYKSTTATYKWDVSRNFVNSRKTTCRLYLPFYGFYELPVPLIISKTLSVYMSYNVPDEIATWIISFDDVIYDFVECDPSIDIPLTGSNAAQIALTKRNTALSIATQVGATAAAIAVGATMQAPALGAALGELGAIYSGAGTIGGVIQSLPWLESSSIAALAGGGAAAAGIGAGAAASGANILNKISNAKLQIGHLMTNLPYHGAASSTTFLNLPMYPYIQFIQNVKMAGWDEPQYKLKVGYACDVWRTMLNMPEESLLQTTGSADMSAMGMELAEIEELNAILQSGFYR